MKLFKVLLVTILLLTPITLSFAGNTDEFLKGNDLDDPLMTSVYVAKSFDLNTDPKSENDSAIRVKLERKNNIGSFSDAEYTVSAGLEF